MDFFDVNMSVGRWPLKMEKSSTVRGLAELCEKERISRALVSSIDPILLYDPEPANRTLFEALEGHRVLIPVPILNLRMRNWRALLERYLGEGRARGVKLYPSYHGYALDSPDVDDLAADLDKAGVPLLICLRIEDERYQHFAMPVPPVPMRSLTELSQRHPNLRVLCLNAYRAEAVSAAGYPGVHVDIAFAEMYQTLPSLLEQLAPEQVLFGSHTPFFVTRAAAMKVVVRAGLDQHVLGAVAHANAERLFGSSRP